MAWMTYPEIKNFPVINLDGEEHRCMFLTIIPPHGVNQSAIRRSTVPMNHSSSKPLTRAL